MDWNGLFTELCLHEQSIRVLFIGCSLGWMLNLVALLIGVSPATQVIVVLNFIPLVPLSVVTGFLTWKCSRLPA